MRIIHDDQGYAKLPEDAVADVLRAGIVGPLFFLLNFPFALCSLLS